MMDVSVSFKHGLGDFAYFCHLVALYKQHGVTIGVKTDEDRRSLLVAAGGVPITANAQTRHRWTYPPHELEERTNRCWVGSKPGWNVSEPPLPDIGPKDQLWDEYCRTRVWIEPHLPADAVETAQRWCEGLQRPVVLLHSTGSTAMERKSFPVDLQSQFYDSFVRQSPGTLVLLDWHNRVAKAERPRVMHLKQLGDCNIDRLMALMVQADLIVGVDSGPLHCARFTSTPTIGVWMPRHYPARYTLPRCEQLNVVLAGDPQVAALNKYKRIPWTIVEHPGNRYTGEGLMRFVNQMLDGRWDRNRSAQPGWYLPSRDRAADIQLRQFAREFCHGGYARDLECVRDRDKTCDALLRRMSRFKAPTVVETGTIRAVEDWPGAGFFTYLMGCYLHRRGEGKLWSVDVNLSYCQFSRRWTEVFGAALEVVNASSLDFLRSSSDPIDVLYCDSLDTNEPGHAEHGLAEVRSAMPRLHEQSLVLFDDTPGGHVGPWRGKGAMAIPWLLGQGWRIVEAGYQVLLERTSP